jgi:hypothetical protein
MPSFQFKDSDNKVFELLTPGDYVAEVKSCEFGIQSGGKTNGAENMELKFGFDGHEAGAFETLIFHPSCEWKIDTFVKSMNLLIDGRAPRKGENIDFTEHMVVGLRGWVTVKTEVYEKKGDERGKPTGKANRIAVFITNKEKLAKRVYVGSGDPDNVGF